MSEYAKLATAEDDAEETTRRLELHTEEQQQDLLLEQQTDGSAGRAEHAATALLAQKNEEIVALQRQLIALTPRSGPAVGGVHRGSSVSSGPAEREQSRDDREKLEAALQENAKLRQVMSSAKAVANDEKNLLRVLSSAERSLLEDGDDEEAQARSSALRPLAPAERSLRKVWAGELGKTNWANSGAAWFTPEGDAFAVGGEDNELAHWDMCSGRRTVLVKRSGWINGGEQSPDRSRVCIAADEGFGMYSASPGSDGLYTQEWEAATGTSVAGARFSRDGTHVALVHAEGGVLELLNARTSEKVASAKGFPVGHCGDGRPGWSAGAISFSETLLAVAGKRKESSANQVRLFSAQNLETVATLDLPGDVCTVAFSPDGTLLAVGLFRPENTPLLRIFSSQEDWTVPPLVLPNINPADMRIASLGFSHDGAILAAGCTHNGSGHFVLWDVEARVCIRTLDSTHGYGHTLAWSPASDLLACGGDTHGMTLHEMLPRKPLTFSLPGNRNAPLSAACASESLVVLASGTRLVAMRRSDDKAIFQMDVKEEIHADHYPMALAPNGEQVAVCMEKLKAVLLRNLHTGQELHLQNAIEGHLQGLNYSADGSLLLVYGGHPQGRVTVYEAATGQELHNFETSGGNVHHAVVDPSGKLLATTGHKENCHVRDLASGEIVHTLEDSCHTQGLSFDGKGERLAYYCQEHLSKNPEVIICDPRGGWRELQRFRVRDWDWVHCDFSPGEGKYLLARCNPEWAGATIKNNNIAFIDLETGEEPAWSKCFRGLMLPPGEIRHHTIRWVTSLQNAEDDDISTSPPLILQAAIDTELHLIDVTAFIRSFEEDGNFSVDQLGRLSEHFPEAIPMLLEKWPYIINVRDEQTGDTVLHHCARSGNPRATKLWLTGTVSFTPIENNEGRSALREATDKQQLATAKELVRLLDRSLDLQRTGTLTKDLVAIADKWPRQLVDFIEVLEQDSECFVLFRKLRTLDVLNTHLDDFDARASADGRGTESWDSSQNVQYEDGEKEVKCDATLEVVALSGFAAAPMKDTNDNVVLPPYTQLFNAVSDNDDRLSALLETKLMRAATKFKWDTYVRHRVLFRLAKYLMHFALAGVALLISTQTTEQNTEFHSNGGWAGEWNSVTWAMSADLLMGCLFVTNTCVLYREFRQLRLTSSIKEHLSDGWNLVDLSGIVALYTGCFAHFTQATPILRQVGSLGVLLNSFSVLQLLTPYHHTGATPLYCELFLALAHRVANCSLLWLTWTTLMGAGPLIKTVIEIMCDIRGYLILIGILLTGFSVSFAVSMPDNEAFENGISGPLVGLLTTFKAVVGSFHMSDYQTTLSTASFLFFLFLNVIVMLNLLIAIMSDSYEKVKDGEVVEALKLRAETIIAEEAMMSEADWRNTSYFPAYLEVLQAKEKPDIVWSGVSGQISKLDKKVTEKVGEAEQAVKAVSKKVDKVEDKVDEMSSKVEALQKDMDAKLERILRVLTEADGALKLGPEPEPEQEPEPEPEPEPKTTTTTTELQPEPEPEPEPEPKPAP